MSAGTSALALGLAQLLDQLGQAYAFNSVPFNAAPTSLAPSIPLEPRGLTPGPEYTLEIVARTDEAAFAAGLPAHGDTITDGSVNRSVVAAEHIRGTPFVVLVLSA